MAGPPARWRVIGLSLASRIYLAVFEGHHARTFIGAGGAEQESEPGVVVVVAERDREREWTRRRGRREPEYSRFPCYFRSPN